MSETKAIYFGLFIIVVLLLISQSDRVFAFNDIKYDPLVVEVSNVTQDGFDIKSNDSRAHADEVSHE